MDKIELRNRLNENFSLPDDISKELFDDVVEECIKHDDLECMWRLCFKCPNYNTNRIEDFYITKRNSYYVCELLSICSNVDIERFINKIIETNDIDFIGEIYLSTLLDDDIKYKLIPVIEKLKKESTN